MGKNCAYFRGKYVIVLFLIVLSQLVIILYWRSEKGNYYIDEFFSMESINGFTSLEGNSYIDSTPEWTFSKWQSIDEFKDRLDGHVTNNKAECISAMRYILHKPLYDCIVFLVREMTSGYFSIPLLSFVINCCFFVLTHVFLAIISNRISNNCLLSILTASLFGYCGFTISMVMYLRFYFLVIFLFVVFLFLLYKMWITDTISSFFLFEFGAVLSSIFICNMQPLFMVFLFVFMIPYIIGLFIFRNKRSAIAIFIQMVLGGILFLLRYPFVFKSINAFIYGDASSENYHVVHILSSIKNLNLYEFKDRFESLKYGIWIFCYGSEWAMYIICIITLAAIGFSLIYWMRKSNCPTKEDGYIVVCTMGTIAYYLFIVIGGEQNIIRYSIFSIVGSFIIIPYWIGKMVHCIRQIWDVGIKKRIVFGVFYGLILFVVFSEVLNTNREKMVSNLYSEDKCVISDLQKDYDDCDILVVYMEPQINVYGPLYESVYYTKYGHEIQCVLGGPANTMNLKDRLVLYTPLGEGEQVTDYFDNIGYKIVCIGKMHISEVYYVEKEFV